MVTLKMTQHINFDYIYELIKKDESKVEQLLQLYKKWDEKLLTIGFTGHFSAGKSSMINKLINKDLLPSSPIPTSANIVEIKNGTEQVKYHFNNGDYAIENRINIEQVKKLSRNGETVHSLTIYDHIPLLSDSVSLMDTPGIDSSDDLEFKRTLDQVHLIDCFIYVMDYNHVQSEVNFNFLSQLQKRNVPFYIVVNQVDKHNEREISFASYKQSLLNSCKAWNLKPKNIFYTTLIDREHTLNELQLLIQEINHLIERKDELVEHKIKNELSIIIDGYLDELFEINETDTTTLNKLDVELKHLNDELSEITKEKMMLENTILSNMTKTLSNAYLMDFDTREKAKDYLESLHPKFKVGTLFSRKKTEEEKQTRKQNFIKHINDRIKTEMVWHIRELLVNTLDYYSIRDEQLKHDIQTFELQINEQQINQVTNHQANVSGDYILLFSDQLQTHITQLIKNELTNIVKILTSKANTKLDEKTMELQAKLKSIKEGLGSSDKVNYTLQKKNEMNDDILSHVYSDASDNSLINNIYETNEQKRQQINIESIINEDEPGSNQDTEKIEIREKLNIDQITQLANQYLTEIKPYEYLNPFKEAIENRLNQMEKMQFTVALFGAFSAGKSSFANAWIGEDVLPVSPNPTTAAINRILPVNNQNKHEDVFVYFKSEDMMVSQLSQILSPYTDEKFSDLKAIYTFLNKRWSHLSTILDQTEASFLNAFQTGFNEMHDFLSSHKQVVLNDYRKYVTVEHISCFVDRIDIYYDCELTRYGVTLVDTPGADSIHSRHTNVAMHYVQHSDLIVYVNYYNHAFSRADREFLTQLGQVKNAFSLDKMFFILNASDLAKDEQELTLVTDYLNNQLTQYGITNPTIFPLSSKLLLENPHLKNVGERYSDFFARFEQFINEDAKAILVNGLTYEIERLNAFLKQTIKEAKEDEKEQKLLINKNKKQLDDLNSWYSNLDKRQYEQGIIQEIEELTHYMYQRMMIQLLDLMKESINPATIQSNGKKGKEELKIAIKHLWALLNEKLEKEFQTTDILLNKQLNRTLQKTINQINEFIQEQTEFSLIYFDEKSFPSAKKDIRLNQTIEEELSGYLSIFKNKKEFFEQNKVKELYEQLESSIASVIKVEIDKNKNIYLNHYKRLYNTELNHIINHYQSNINLFIDAKERLFTDPILVNELEQIVNLELDKL
ncbi:dynamin family protein [Bacillaceae bacterium W0354]